MNTMNNYEYNECIEFNGLMPKVMEADGIETIGASDFNAKLFENGHLGGGSLEVVDFFGTAFGENGGGEDDKHEYVDLGLSVKWATMNIGANSPEEAGLYFAWGETQGYTVGQVGVDKNFTWEDYQWGNPNSGTLITDELVEDGVLKSDYDAATVNWGEGWRMPTKAEIEELMELPHSWDAPRSGYSFTDANNNELLFVFAGGYADNGNVYGLGENGDYWSGSFGGSKETKAWLLNFNSDKYKIGSSNRYMGHTVRPVRSQNL